MTELHKKYSEFREAGAEIIPVQREERDGAAGLETTVKKTGAKFPILNDPEGKSTARYQTDEGFPTYVIGKDGKVLRILSGTKTKRPSAGEIFESLSASLTE